MQRWTQKTFQVATGVLVLCAGLLTWGNVKVLYEKKQPRGALVSIQNWQRYAKTGSRIGAARPLVTLLEFTDYQCPACKVHERELQGIVDRHPSEVAIIVRQFPIKGDLSMSAALAAICTAKSGKFPQYHSLLMRSAKLHVDSLLPLAIRVGVTDTLDWKKCAKSTESLNKVRADIAAARELGVFLTPTVFVNGDEHLGAEAGFEDDVQLRLRNLR